MELDRRIVSKSVSRNTGFFPLILVPREREREFSFSKFSVPWLFNFWPRNGRNEGAFQGRARSTGEDGGEYMDNHGEFEYTLSRELDEVGRPGNRAFPGSVGEKDHRGHDRGPKRRDVRRQLGSSHGTTGPGIRVELRQSVSVLSDRVDDHR